MKKAIITLLILTLFLLPMVSAEEDFSAQSKSLYTLEKCSAVKNVITVSNTGDQTNNYKLTSIGKTSAWIRYPGLFSIQPGKYVNAEAIIQVPCNIDAGMYQLTTVISTTTGLEKEIVQDLVVLETENIQVSVDKIDANINPCDSAVFTIDITNPASFQEKYKLSADKGDLSENEIVLHSNETKQISLTYKPKNCLFVGSENILFTAETSKTQLIAELDLIVEIEDSGIPEIASGVEKIRTYYNENVVDIEIFNTGKDDTEYIISVDGPDWITVSPRMITIPGTETSEVTLNLAPTFEVKKGKYDFTIIAEVASTGAKYEKELIVKLTTPGIIDNLFDKYLPLTVLIIIALIVFTVIAVYLIQYMSTEEYQKYKLQRMREKEKLKKQRERERAVRQKEKARLMKERELEKKKILAEREKAREQRLKEKERIQAQKDKKRATSLLLKAKKERDREREIAKKEKEKQKAERKYAQELRKNYFIISKEDIAEGKNPKNVFGAILLIIILLAILVLITVFIRPLLNNIEYVIIGIIVLIILYTLARIRRLKVVKTKWRGISLAKEKKIFDINWRKGLQQIKIKLASPITNLRATVRRGRGRNERYICIDEHIYQYFKAESNADSEEISETEFTFKIKNKWLQRKKIDDEEVCLYHLDNGEWKELETEKTGWDEKYVYYKAKTEKLGQFAIIGTETAEELEEKEPKSKGLFALIGIIVIALLIFLLLNPISFVPPAGIPAQSWLQGEQHSIDLNKYFQDPDGDVLEFSVLEEVSGIDITFREGIAYLTPDLDFIGDATVVFTATDHKGGIAESNPVKLVVKNKTMNLFSRILRFGLGLIIILTLIAVIIKLAGIIRTSIKED